MQLRQLSGGATASAVEFVATLLECEGQCDLLQDSGKGEGLHYTLVILPQQLDVDQKLQNVESDILFDRTGSNEGQKS